MTTILKFLKQAFLFLFLFASLSSNASHNAGMAITYTYTGTPNSYLVRFYFYRDITGIPAPTQINLCYSSASCVQSGAILLAPIAGTGQAITLGPCIPAGGAPAIEEWVYEGMVTLPMACTDWTFSYSECCRAGGIMNIQPNGMFVYATLDNVNFPANSSPYFINPPYSQHCIFSNTNRSFACIDIDGDSLVYELSAALDASGGCPSSFFSSTYIAPYNPLSPFSSSVPIILDASSGNLNFTPDIFQIAAVGVVVKEYRNGQLVGEIQSDNYITSVNGLLATDAMKGKVYQDLNTNAIYDAGEPGMGNQIITIQPGPYYYSTNFVGDYNALLPVGSFIATASSNYPYYYYSPASHSANFPAGYMVDSLNDFGFAAYSNNIQDLRITISGGNVRPGFPSTITLTATNIGTLTTNATVNVSLDNMFTITNTLPAAASSTSTSATWNISNFQSMQSQNFSIAVMTSASAVVGDTLFSSAEIQPTATDTVPADNFDELMQHVVNSCDPNEKLVYPNDFITQAQITNGLYLEYTINFQNTGSAPAINISIVDTLDANFVIPSFEVLSASHAYTWTISGQGIITFTFTNIYLPDSGANKPASHGFIKYRLRPSTNFANYVKLTNTSYIYFDNNAPIQTNYTSTHVYNTTGIIKTENGNSIFIYPNPSKGKISIACSDKTVSEMQVSLYSIIGKKVYEKKIKNTEANETVELNNFSKGIYFVKVIANNKSYQQKIVLE